MTTISPGTAERLHTQGFTNVDDDWLAEIAPWLRWSPVLCGTIAAVGTALASPWVLLLLACTAFLGAVLPFHPFDLIYNYGIRFLVGKRPLPPNRAPRRFACGVATVWLVATAFLFSIGQTTAGYMIGTMFVGVAALVSTTDICIASIIFNYFVRRQQRIAS
ncbi:MAG: DUF4395 domain-containing protein [Micropepsaceae bacterium]